VDAGALVAAVRRDADRAGTGFVERRVPVSRAAPLAALAMALLLVEAGGLGLASWRRWRAGGVIAAALLLAGAGPLEESEARLRARPDDALALVAVGIARAEAGDAREAERAFLAAALRARDPGAAALAYYDLGVSALGRGDLEGARDAFLDALALAPNDREARFNLEWTLAALAETPILVAPQPEADAKKPPREGPGQAPGQPGSEADETAEGKLPQEPEAAEGEQRAEGTAEGTSGTQRERERAELTPARLGADEAARWLEAVRDDPGRALASAAQAATPPQGPAHPDAPTW
jgi:tetratricopeptide (TPR) repeat protein